MRATTIAALIAELIETHIEKCGDDAPHIVSAISKTSSNIDQIVNRDNVLFLDLSDGTAFTITVSKTA